ncbi:hypothetical protein CT676_41535 [Bradyrhizobium sp. MOS001]|nr:hypothetical protein CT676_41535 [Bradyrhizobium sp. MOS001]
MSTSILKSLTFVPQPKVSSDPLILKRERMVSRLEDQKKLFADPLYQRRIKRWEKKEGGEKVLVEKPLRTSKWWQQDQNGGYVMTVKVGSKRIEFEKGKAAIAVGPLEKLPTVIDALIKAVRAGELDSQLSEASKSARPLPSRKVA